MEDPADLNEEQRARPNDWILLRSFSADAFEPVQPVEPQSGKETK
jgi:hypothetical protein